MLLITENKALLMDDLRIIRVRVSQGFRSLPGKNSTEERQPQIHVVWHLLQWGLAATKLKFSTMIKGKETIMKDKLSKLRNMFHQYWFTSFQIFIKVWLIVKLSQLIFELLTS